jgi:hypothetical protein
MKDIQIEVEIRELLLMSAHTGQTDHPIPI